MKVGDIENGLEDPAGTDQCRCTQPAEVERKDELPQIGDGSLQHESDTSWMSHFPLSTAHVDRKLRRDAKRVAELRLARPATLPRGPSTRLFCAPETTKG